MIMPSISNNERKVQFIEAQQKDESLRKCYELANTISKIASNAKWKFTFNRGILTRLYLKETKS